MLCIRLKQEITAIKSKIFNTKQKKVVFDKDRDKYAESLIFPFNKYLVIMCQTPT